MERRTCLELRVVKESMSWVHLIMSNLDYRIDSMLAFRSSLGVLCMVAERVVIAIIFPGLDRKIRV